MYCSETKVNTMIVAIKESFPNANLKLENNYVIKVDKVQFMDLLDWLGKEGWEMTSGYRYLSDRVQWLFKHSNP